MYKPLVPLKIMYTDGSGVLLCVVVMVYIWHACVNEKHVKTILNALKCSSWTLDYIQDEYI